MRCPRCLDEHADVADVCVRCGADLVDPEGSSTAKNPAPVPARADARLGTFDPLVVERVTDLLARRQIAYETVTGHRGIEVLVDAGWRDDVRSELALSWTAILRELPDAEADEVRARGGWAAGWFDAPRGGHVDRQGRLVVGADEREDAQTDATRVVGPGLVTGGAIATIAGVWVVSSTALVLLGLTMVVVGLLTPN